jgi:ATP diphosphatase
VDGLEQKMRRRHPHLHGDEPASWAEIKRRERAARGVPVGIVDAVPAGLDPLTRAFRVQARVAEFGFDWADWRGAWAKLHEEVEEVGRELEAGDTGRLDDELGDLLFAVVNLVRLAGSHPQRVLSQANHKFERRFAGVERLAAEHGLVWGEATLEELDRLWDEVKRRERETPPEGGR